MNLAKLATVKSLSSKDRWPKTNYIVSMKLSRFIPNLKALRMRFKAKLQLRFSTKKRLKNSNSLMMVKIDKLKLLSLPNQISIMKVNQTMMPNLWHNNKMIQISLKELLLSKITRLKSYINKRLKKKANKIKFKSLFNFKIRVKTNRKMQT